MFEKEPPILESEAEATHKATEENKAQGYQQSYFKLKRLNLSNLNGNMTTNMENTTIKKGYIQDLQ